MISEFSTTIDPPILEHFHISNLFNKYLDKGYNQQNLSEKFKKSKSFISIIISIKKSGIGLICIFVRVNLWLTRWWSMASQKIK